MNNTKDMSFVKQANYKEIWGYIRKNTQVTIPQISKAVGLSLPTVTRAVDYGVEKGVLTVGGIIGGERGRRALSYSLADDYMHFLLITVDSKKLGFELHDFNSNVIDEGCYPVSEENIIDTVESISMKFSREDKNLAVIAISLTGVIYDGEIRASFCYPVLAHSDIKTVLEEKTGKTILICNDMKVAAQASLSYMNGTGDGITVVYYYGQIGYGAGVIIDGKVLEGANGAAAELGAAVATVDSSSRLEFAVQMLQSTIASFNPNRVILFPNSDDVTADELTEEVKKRIPEYMHPEFIVGKDIQKDYFLGLSILCEQEAVSILLRELF